MRFYKTSSFGNDFIEVAAAEIPPGRERGVLAREICDRQRGVGADGIVVYDPAPDGGRFAIFNRDGSAAELSGNGMAGLAAVLLQRRLARSPLTLRSGVGARRVVLSRRQGGLFHLDVEIGKPDFASREFFPFLKRGRDAYGAAGIEFHPVAVGNPHAVVVCRHFPGAARLAELGKKLEGHPLFPRRVNVEFVEPQGEGRCRVFFYERGVGPTLASSTGSAAVFAVLRRLGTADGGPAMDHVNIIPAPGPAGDDASGRRPGYPAGEDDTIHVYWQEGIFIRNRTRIVCRGEFTPA